MFVVTMTALLAAAVLGLGIALRWPQLGGRRLRQAALAMTVAVAVALAPYTVADSGVWSLYLLGVPVVAAGVPVVADLAGAGRVAADAFGAVVLTGWALLLALGIGAAFLPGALVLVMALTSGLSGERSPSAPLR